MENFLFSYSYVWFTPSENNVFINLLLMQTSYNVIAYKDKPRLRTALEMLRTTQEIESRLQEVRVLFLFVLVSSVYTRHSSFMQLLVTFLILVSITIVNSLV
jgi:hypothetical protein